MVVDRGSEEMALKDVLVQVDQPGASVARLQLVADLAHRHGANLTALFVRERTAEQLELARVAQMGLVPESDIAAMDSHIATSMEETARRIDRALHAMARERGVSAELRTVEGPAIDAVSQYARFADLCVLGHSAAAPDQTRRLWTRLLLTTERPVLFVPEAASFTTIGRHILLAWNASPAVTHALDKSLPLFELAERTTILLINPSDIVDRYGGLSTKPLVEHLKHHGVAVDIVTVTDAPRRSISDVIQSKALELGADLVVIGAYSHPRLWEALLGGVTRSLLESMSLPILMAH